jgi:hypothetical protein
LDDKSRTAREALFEKDAVLYIAYDPGHVFVGHIRN